VGVELQTPANVWGIQLPPEDWLRFPGAASAAATVSALAAALHSDVAATAEQKIHVLPESLGINSETLPSPTADVQQSFDASPGLHEPIPVEPDEVRRTFDAKLLHAAEKAVSLAVTSHVNAAINQAVKTVETFSQAILRDAERHDLIYRETLVASAREELAASFAEAQEAAQRLEHSSSEVHIILAEALTFLQETAGELGKQFYTRLRATADQEAVDFGDKTTTFSDRRIAHLAEQVQATTGEAITRLDGKAAEASAQLDSLSRLAAEARAEWESRQEASREDLARATEQDVQQFRQRMEAIWNFSMTTAMSVVNEHSRNLLDALSKEPARQLREASHEPSSR